MPPARRSLIALPTRYWSKAMAVNEDRIGKRRPNRWRIAGWGMAVLILMVPFIAMQFTSEMNWDAFDFIFMGAMLGAVGVGLELAFRWGQSAYRLGAAAGLAAAFLLVWVNGAVGFLGDEGNPANLMFLGVIWVAIIGAFIARARPAGMATTMFVTAGTQALAGAIGLLGGYASPGADGLYEVAMGTTVFGGLWLLSGALFRKAAGEQAPRIAAD
jgi:hypothetical protein